MQSYKRGIPKQEVTICDSMTEEEFHTMIDKGMQQVKNNVHSQISYYGK